MSWRLQAGCLDAWSRGRSVRLHHELIYRAISNLVITADTPQYLLQPRQLPAKPAAPYGPHLRMGGRGGADSDAVGLSWAK